MSEVTLTVNLAGASPNEPVSIYHLGQSFYLAGRRCLLNIEVGPGITQCLTSPGVVNLCLASELFMKSLVVSNGGTPTKTHRLSELFVKLTEAQRQAIADQYSKFVSDPSLTDLLVQVSEYFEKVRYGYEFNVFAYHEHPITMLAGTLYKYCATAYGQSVGIDRMRA